MIFQLYTLSGTFAVNPILRNWKSCNIVHSEWQIMERAIMLHP